MTARHVTHGQGKQVVTRFAPSPTGRLHLGHAFSAVQSHDRARAAGGRFLLRIEDIDGMRSRPEHVAGIVEDLRWLGLDWDGDMLFQSTRLDAYQAALDTLKAQGLLYRCYCTRAEIAQSLSAPHGPGAVYPGTCRHAAPRDDTQHAWRIDMAKAVALAVAVAGPLDWHDELAGVHRADPLAQGDVVLARKDAPAYHLAVVVDDAFQGVTHIVRGEDLRAATDIHRLLQHLLGLPTPIYRHHPLLLGTDGDRLAKRNGAPGLAALRAQGVDGRALADDLRAGRHPIGFSLSNA
ncbi:tRNA glutamyl-Q(34) synthetase GluQRS [Sphingomonas sp. PB4P5]|uniref:tRNA glutamyl-Q(34) synthetase GluQRS n=1 Tax=Parasphingomonas puruogangriensis TaxID=3096155 RepID=UPI002FC6833B